MSLVNCVEKQRIENEFPLSSSVVVVDNAASSNVVADVDGGCDRYSSSLSQVEQGSIQEENINNNGTSKDNEAVVVVDDETVILATTSITPDSFLVTCCKRLLIQLPLLFLIVNTFSTINSIVADIQKKDFVVNELQCSNQWWNNNNNYNLYPTCDVIHPMDLDYSCSENLLYEKVTFQCPYTIVIPYIALLITWGSYCFIVSITRFCFTYSYHTNDFRFIIANDIFNLSSLGQWLCYVGYLFTIGSGIVGLYFANSHQKGYEMILINISFMIGNCFAIKRLFMNVLDIRLPTSSSPSSCCSSCLSQFQIKKQYPKEVLYRIPSRQFSDGCYGYFYTLEQIVKILSNALIISMKLSKKEYLSTFGNANDLEKILDDTALPSAVVIG